jgi:hypothetical protein
MSSPNANSHEALDALLDGALASYTPAEPPLGLETRVSVRLAASAAGQSCWRVFAPAWAWAASALLVVSLAIAAIHAHRQTHTESKLQPVPAARPRPADAVPSAQSEAASPVKPALRSIALRPAHWAAMDTTAEASLYEMRAPSRPAPQAPLTAEEMLLLRVAHHRDPEQLAMLNPEVRASRAAESDREFQEFVEQSSTGNE